MWFFGKVGSATPSMSFVGNRCSGSGRISGDGCFAGGFGAGFSVKGDLVVACRFAVGSLNLAEARLFSGAITQMIVCASTDKSTPCNVCYTLMFKLWQSAVS
jgi:hypothetical protein